MTEYEKAALMAWLMELSKAQPMVLLMDNLMVALSNRTKAKLMGGMQQSTEHDLVWSDLMSVLRIVVLKDNLLVILSDEMMVLLLD